MKTSAAVTKSVASDRADYVRPGEIELLQRAVNRDDEAWRELQRRYGKIVRGRIQWVALRYESVLPSDAVDEMEQDFWCSLVWDDFAKLRAFKPKRGRRRTFRRLGSWLSLLALRHAWNYVHKSFHREETGRVEKLFQKLDNGKDSEAE